MRFLILLCSMAAFIYAQDLETKMLFLQKPSDDADDVLLIVTWSKNPQQEMPKVTNCEIYSDEEVVKRIVKEAGENTVSKPSMQEMIDLIEDCTELLRRKGKGTARTEFYGLEYFSESNRRRRSNEVESRVSEETLNRWKSEPHDSNLVFPGTKWCGAGDKAQSYDDLGEQEGVDKCCRAHDLCDDMLRAGEKKDNIINDSSFTKLNCTCDNEFYDCLLKDDSKTAITIGNTYFNVLRRECYMLNYPLTGKCLKYKTFLNIICSEWERNTNAPMVYEWVDARWFPLFGN
ncbi:Phospholipase A2, partial [Stegodyphus mimosarum]